MAHEHGPYEERVMLSKVRVPAAALLICGCMALPTSAQASESLTFRAALTPDALGAPTNISATATFTSVTTLNPVTKVAVYAPAGLTEDLNGVEVCSAAILERIGASACPVDSRAGFGGGVARLELGSEVIHEPFTVDIFLASRDRRHLSFLAYARGSSPASVELILKAQEIPAPKPYGFGFSVETPPLPTIPGASETSIESAFVTLGAPNVAYYKTVHGKRTLVHIKGLLAPTSCPHGGFPFRGQIYFANGATSASNAFIPCPKR
jgi:hypothetical protein